MHSPPLYHADMPSLSSSASPLLRPVVERVEDVTAFFADSVELFRLRGAFSGSELRVHPSALRRRVAFASGAEAVSDSTFSDAVRDVLREWDVGSRGTELVPSDVFRTELRKLVPQLAELEQAQIDELPGVASMVWRLLDSICLVRSPKTGRLSGTDWSVEARLCRRCSQRWS